MVRIPRSALAAVAGVLLALGLTVPLVLRTTSPSSPSAPPAVYLNATLAPGPAVGRHLASPFFGSVVSIVNRTSTALRGLGAFLNSTPIAQFRLGGGGEAYDPTTDTNYEAPSGGGPLAPVSVQLWNLSWFRAYCTSRPSGCSWLGYLPAEENDTALAVAWATWYHAVLGFAPTYWQFGNEPDSWTHYGEPLATWSTADNATVSSAAYATMVRNYIAAISAIYPRDRYVGIEASCACNTGLISSTAAVDGPELASLAYHSYPAGTDPADVTSFLSALDGSQNLSTTSSHVRSLVASSCGGCAGLPIVLGEYQAGPFGERSPLAGQYPGAVFLAASVIEALEANVSTLTIYDSGSLYNMTTSTVSPEGLLYQRILANLSMGTDAAVEAAAPGMHGVYSITVTNGSREALFVVNANTTFGLRLTVPPSLFPIGTSGSVFAWDPSTSEPSAERAVPLPGTYEVPPEGILLATTY